MVSSINTAVDPELVDEVDLGSVFISLAICIFGLVGNAMAIFIVVTLKEYKKSITHWYILHLAIADSIFLLTLPFQVSAELNGIWIYPEWLCKAKETILFCNYYASILFLMVMSIDRYLAVCRSFSVVSKWLRKREVANAIAPTVWVMALCLSIPIVLYSTTTGEYPKCKCTYEFPKSLTDDCANEGAIRDVCEKLMKLREEKLQCRPISGGNGSAPTLSLTLYNFDPSTFGEQFVETVNIDEEDFEMSGDGSAGSGVSDNISDTTDGSSVLPSCHYQNQASGFILFLILNFAIMFVAPLLIMVGCYGLIILKLSNTQMRTAVPTPSFTSSGNGVAKPSQKKRQSSRSQIDRRRVTIMCAALVTCFVICWLPFHAVHLAKIVGIKNTETRSCIVMFKFGTLLAFLNSALNPYLYSFLGTNFGRRWRTATYSFRRTFSRNKGTSTASFTSVRQNPNRNRERKTSNTGMTKLSKAQELKQTAFETVPIAPCMETRTKVAVEVSSSDSGVTNQMLE